MCNLMGFINCTLINLKLVSDYVELVHESAEHVKPEASNRSLLATTMAAMTLDVKKTKLSN